jgi:hypothetical protein
MDRKLFSEKIQKLSNDDLVRLLQMRNESNAELISLVESEAVTRNIDVNLIKPLPKKEQRQAQDSDEINWFGILASLVNR